ncbi:glycosyltransferase [bacterium]|nr:glycosyltransferase [bacterium]
MKRVLVLNANIRERGTWFRARKVARGLFHRGHDVTFVCQGEGWYRPRIRQNHPRWFEWETASWSPLRVEEGHAPLAVMQRILKLRGHWDLVYTFSHLPVDSAVAHMVRDRSTFWITDWCDLWNSTQGGIHDVRCWPKPLPPFLTGWKGVYTRFSHRLEDATERQVAIDADAVSIIASPMLEETRKLGIDDRRILHMISGADTRNIKPQDRSAARRQLSIDEDALLAVYVANFTPDNIQLERALELSLRNNPRLQVLSVGPRWYPEKGYIAEQVRRGRVLDMGRRPFAEIPLFLGAADFLLMPIRDTPLNRCRWPNKFGDYMASGRPTATTDVGDMGRVCREYNVGIASESTHEGLARSIDRLAGDPDLRASLGANALHAARNHFSWASRVHRLAAFLNSHGVDI